MRAGSRSDTEGSPSRHRLMLEPLEPGILLSGTVTVAVVGGDLVITGDNAGNSILITEVCGDIIVSRQDGDTMITDGTTTGDSVTMSGVTGDTVIKMIDIYWLDVFDVLDIRTGKDGDEVWLDETWVTGPMNVRTESGDDFVSVGKSLETLEVYGEVRLDGGKGYDGLAWGSSDFLADVTVRNFKEEII